MAIAPKTEQPRQVALELLKAIQRGGFADVVLNERLQHTTLAAVDRRLTTELVYGTVRRQRTLDALIDQLARKPAAQQPSELRLILHLGLYQLRYLDQIPDSAAVNTTVDLAKQNGFKGLAGFVNGLLRQYIRNQSSGQDSLILPTDPVSRFGVQYSYPDWVIEFWIEQVGLIETEQLCDWFNQAPTMDLRVNPLKTTLLSLHDALNAAGYRGSTIPGLPQALRLAENVGNVRSLPGFREGWWTVQDASAQLVSQLLDPQPGETIIDACAAPGGKTTHIAELMGDRGIVWGCDCYDSRLKKLRQNAQRLQLTSIQYHVGDSRQIPHFKQQGDRVLVDVPCSGLGTLHRHADARWRQTPDSMHNLTHLQRELLWEAATWVKPGGILVYSTCTLSIAENEQILQQFLQQHPDWILDPLNLPEALQSLITPEGWLRVWPHRQHWDGFFIARLRHCSG